MIQQCLKDKAILYDTAMFYEYEEGKDGVKRVEDNILKINEKEKIDLYDRTDENGNLIDLSNIEIAIRTKELPMGGIFRDSGYPILIVSDEYDLYDRTDENGNLIDLSNIEIAIRTKELPMGGIFRDSGYPILIVSDEYINKLQDVALSSMMISAEDPYKVQEKIIELDKTNKDNIYNFEEEVKANNTLNLIISIFLYGFIAVISIIGITNIFNIDKTNKDNIYNFEEEVKANNTLNLIISIFLYGFIAVISIIGITNIFNTITTNMALRNREFAILKSIGMTNKEFRKMINYESFIYGLKALILGLPVGVLLSYFMYKVTTTIYEEPYELPIVSIIISIIFVFVVIAITMQYSVKKTKKQNIIETIRKENIYNFNYICICSYSYNYAIFSKED